MTTANRLFTPKECSYNFAMETEMIKFGDLGGLLKHWKTKRIEFLRRAG